MGRAALGRRRHLRVVAATRSRKAKVVALAELLGRASPDELETVTAYLGGALRQRRTGLELARADQLPPPAAEPSLTVLEVHDDFDRIAGLAGSGSQATRSAAVADVFGRATADEQAWLRGVVTGGLRQGALDSLVQEALAAAADVPLAAVRRAAMLGGSTVAVARATFEGVDALGAVGLQVGRPVLPMLASSAPDVAAAPSRRPGPRGGGRRPNSTGSASRCTGAATTSWSRPGRWRTSPPGSPGGRGGAVAPGRRVRARRGGARARRRRTAAAVPGDRVAPPWGRSRRHAVLLRPAAPRRQRPARRPRRRAGRRARAAGARRAPGAAAGDRVGRRGADFLEHTIGSGHGASSSKEPARPYDAGRRGAMWVKVKPVHPLDLVVLAVEWGSGRRQGWLSNIHLGARDHDGGFVMLSKTFKGMTDEMLAWQTERFPRSQRRPGPPTSCTCGPSRWSRSPSTACSGPRATPAGRTAVRPGGPLPRRQTGGRDRHDRHGAGVPAGLSQRPQRVGRHHHTVQLRVARSYDVAVSTLETDGRRTAAAARQRAARSRSSTPPRRLFDERGVPTPDRDIAKAVGINRAIVYRHFTGKEVFALTLVGYLDELRAELAGAAASTTDPRTGWPRWSAPSWSTAWRTRRSSTAPRP